MSYAQLIVNPTAGAGKTAKKWPHIKELLQGLGLDFEYALTEAPGHAVELASSAARKGCKLIISVGGDGTINEVVNGLNDANCLKDVMLGIISTGTGADYIRTLGIPRAHDEACRLFVKPKTRIVDLGVVEFMRNNGKIKRLFVNFAGLGFDAETVKATTQTYKAMGAMASYLMALLATLVFYQNKEVSIIAEGVIEQRKIVTILMGNGKYAGGSMMTTPNADPSDGLFDVLIVDDMTKLDLLRSLPRLYKGTHLTHPKVFVKRVKEIEIRPRLKMSLQVDGDLIGEAPARFYVLPAALNVVV
jgi:YegS/Rv2252/BmrU family lipid kinase